MKKLNIVEIIDSYNSDINNIEKIIFDLKNIGLSQKETTKILIQRLNLSLKVSDNFVVNSKAWQDKFQDNMNLRNNIFDFLEGNFKDESNKDGSDQSTQ